MLLSLFILFFSFQFVLQKKLNVRDIVYLFMYFYLQNKCQ